MSGPIMTAPAAGAQPGWYGKLPGLGDFASRRLPPAFIAFWDAWLQRQLVAARAVPGERWQAAFLASPGWRFVLLPGACGSECWAGLFVPSRDKVGRCFPLTVALGLDPQRQGLGAVFADAGWFDALETVALAARASDAPPDRFDAALLETPGPASQDAGSAAHVLGQWWLQAPSACAPLALGLPDIGSLPGLLGDAAAHALAAGAPGRTLWWQAGRAGAAAPLLACCGMPAEDQAGLLLGGAR